MTHIVGLMMAVTQIMKRCENVDWLQAMPSGVLRVLHAPSLQNSQTPLTQFSVSESLCFCIAELVTYEYVLVFHVGMGKRGD